MKTEQEKRSCDHCGKIETFDKRTIGAPYFLNWIELTIHKGQPYSASKFYDFCSIGCCSRHIETLIVAKSI